MSELTVVAKVIAKKNSIESIKNELQKLIPPTRKEEGCIEYDLHQDIDDPAVFFFYEIWKSIDCLEKHMKTDHFKNFECTVENLIVEKAVHKMARIE